MKRAIVLEQRKQRKHTVRWFIIVIYTVTISGVVSIWSQSIIIRCHTQLFRLITEKKKKRNHNLVFFIRRLPMLCCTDYREMRYLVQRWRDGFSLKFTTSLWPANYFHAVHDSNLTIIINQLCIFDLLFVVNGDGSVIQQMNAFARSTVDLEIGHVGHVS